MRSDKWIDFFTEIQQLSRKQDLSVYSNFDVLVREDVMMCVLKRKVDCLSVDMLRELLLDSKPLDKQYKDLDQYWSQDFFKFPRFIALSNFLNTYLMKKGEPIFQECLYVYIIALWGQKGALSNWIQERLPEGVSTPVVEKYEKEMVECLTRKDCTVSLEKDLMESLKLATFPKLKKSFSKWMSSREL